MTTRARWTGMAEPDTLGPQRISQTRRARVRRLVARHGYGREQCEHGYRHGYGPGHEHGHGTSGTRRSKVGTVVVNLPSSLVRYLGRG